MLLANSVVNGLVQGPELGVPFINGSIFLHTLGPAQVIKIDTLKQKFKNFWSVIIGTI